jgi:transcriptional regulator with XRE-family HTH domain
MANILSMKRVHTYSPYTVEAARLLGSQVAAGRRARRWSAAELADRVGISRPTLGKIESGDPSVGLGVAFEAAALVGVPLFQDDRNRLSENVARAQDRLALLPRRVRSRGPVRDDF